jgi:hypothetical protein
MGKELTHILFAEQTLNSLIDPDKDPLASALHNSPQAFHFGAIVADTFFYGIKMPCFDKAYSCCGEIIHGFAGNDTSLLPLEMLRDLKENPDDPLFREKLAFVSGLLTHIALDSVLHPFIYYFSGNYHHESPEERTDARTRHRLIESWLDLLLLQQVSLNLQDCRFIADIRRNSSMNRNLLRFFHDAFIRTGNGDATSWKFLKRGYDVQMLLNTAFPRAFLGKFVERVNRASKGKLRAFMALFYPWDYKEIPAQIMDFGVYRHPVTGEEFQEDFQSLLLKSQQRGTAFLQAVREYLYGDGDPDKLRDVVKGYSLSMGLVGVSAENAVYFDCVPLNRIWTYGVKDGHKRSKLS